MITSLIQNSKFIIHNYDYYLSPTLNIKQLRIYTRSKYVGIITNIKNVQTDKKVCNYGIKSVN